jgi:1-acyl-sn-glycerol-3-phosphate acyltransferase
MLKRRQYHASHLILAFSKVMAFVLGIKAKVKGDKSLLTKRGAFIVTNHVSYLDGIIISSIFPLIFIARGDLKNWPFFGIFTLISDTIFVDRRDPTGLPQEISKISQALSSGANVILFPEGTTTAGYSISTFKSSFFQAPLANFSPIIPLTIKYKNINGRQLDANNKDLIFWYGDMEFIPHLLCVLALKKIEAEIEILEPINVSQSHDRKQLSLLSQKAIEASLAKCS